jgi:hypothetical protein
LTEHPPIATSSTPVTIAPDRLRVVEGAVLATLLALVSTTVVGYRFGDSNHGITVPILQRLMDRSLYPGDVMVATAEGFPTVFYRLLAAVLPGTRFIPAAFFALYVASMAATFAAVWRIGRWAGGREAAALALLLAFPVRIGLAGEALYRVAFSHSHVASALTLWAIAWFLEGRRLLPILVLSLGAYNHLLYSAYVLVPMMLVVLSEDRVSGRRRTLRLLAAAVVPLVPIAVWSAAHGTPLTREWLQLLRLRSSHHSFPSAFLPDLPGAAALLALALLAAPGLSERVRRLLALFLCGVALQFVVGTVFTEWVPLKAVLQYQPHRSWRFLAVILNAVAAAGLVESWREGGAVARGTACVSAVVLLLPGLESLLPLVVALQAGVGRPTRSPRARIAAALVLLWIGGWGDRPLDYAFLPDLLSRMPAVLVIFPAAVAVIVLASREMTSGWRRSVVAVSVAATLVWLAPWTYARLRGRWESGDWRDVQDWARTATPRDAVFLTPPQESGFRVFSERTVVGEWKDGTQQYFDDAFVRAWGERMRALGGERFASMTDDQVREVAALFDASYVVLPTRPRRATLPLAYKNATWAVYRVPVPGTIPP